MTKGQTSPTSPIGTVTKSSPYGSIEYPIDPVWMALSCGATYVAQALFSQVRLQHELFLNGLRHTGIAVICILAPCTTYKRDTTKDYYKENSFAVPDDHDSGDLSAALNLVIRQPGKFPVGLIYQTQRPCLCDGLEQIEEKARATGETSLTDIAKEFL